MAHARQKQPCSLKSVMNMREQGIPRFEGKAQMRYTGNHNYREVKIEEVG